MIEHYGEWIEQKGTQRRKYTNAICPYCGETFTVLLYNLRRGDTKCCTHTTGTAANSYYNTPTYKTWQGIKDRCSNVKLPCYTRYGGRGISYDKRWEHFCAFLSDMGPCPDGMSIDRVDNNGNYCKENCQWASATAQANNRRSNVKVLYAGEIYTLASFCRKYKLDYKETWHLYRRKGLPLETIASYHQQKTSGTAD